MYGLLQFVYIFEIIGELSTLLSHFSKVKKLKIHLSRFQHFADRTLQNSGDENLLQFVTEGGQKSSKIA